MAAAGSRSIGVAVWPIMSMKPGATTRPVASIFVLRVLFIEAADRGDLAVLDADIGHVR